MNQAHLLPLLATLAGLGQAFKAAGLYKFGPQLIILALQLRVSRRRALYPPEPLYPAIWLKIDQPSANTHRDRTRRKPNTIPNNRSVKP
ncbi:MAG TPA: hypothetical protein DCL32_00110 [Gammaproteobacteria bacterium]|nr:hypothetical protein [Gammaproteobacteria bacterium]